MAVRAATKAFWVGTIVLIGAPAAVIAAEIAVSCVTNTFFKLVILVFKAVAAVFALFAAVIAAAIWVLRAAIWVCCVWSVLALAVTCVWRAFSCELMLARTAVWSKVLDEN